MKTFLPLLLASLAVNILFGALIIRKSPAPIPPETTSAQTPDSVSVPISPGGPGSREAAATAAPAATPTREPLWAGLKGDSLDDAIARLRSAGCPPREIVFAIRAMIQEMTRERRLALGYANETLPYWQVGRTVGSTRPNNEMNDVYLQMQKLERSYLLTPEFFGADEAVLRSYRERYGPLTTETLRRLALLDAERNEKSMQLMATTTSTQAGEAAFSRDPKLRQQLAQEYETALQALLTPEQYAQYELRNGQVASSLRARLANFDPTEAEYLALYALEKNQRQIRESARSQTPEQRQAAQTEYQTALQAALGPDRAADYDALQKAGGDQLPRLIARLNLPLRTITTINAVRDDTSSRARAIRDNAELTPDQRSSQLTALAAEAESDLSALLGTPRGLEAYKDLKGDWLRNLRKPTP